VNDEIIAILIKQVMFVGTFGIDFGSLGWVGV
jgi:type IV secretory pathway TrbL component